jgi:hypothetical protein
MVVAASPRLSGNRETLPTLLAARLAAGFRRTRDGPPRCVGDLPWAPVAIGLVALRVVMAASPYGYGWWPAGATDEQMS